MVYRAQGSQAHTTASPLIYLARQNHKGMIRQK